MTPELSDKTRLTGNPVRSAVIEAAQQPFALPQRDGPFELVVFGGSQGARYFSESVPPALALLPEASAPTVCGWSSRRAAEDMRGCRRCLPGERDRGGGGRVLSRPAAAAGAGPSRDRALWRLDSRRADGHWPPVHPRSAAASLWTMISCETLPRLPNRARLGVSSRRTFRLSGWRDDLGALLADPARLQRPPAAARRLGRPDAVGRLADLVEELIGSQVMSRNRPGAIRVPRTWGHWSAAGGRGIKSCNCPARSGPSTSSASAASA